MRATTRIALALLLGRSAAEERSCNVLDEELGGVLRPWMLPDIDRKALAGDELRAHDWTAEGTAFFQAGKHDLAIQHLIVATKDLVFGSHLWANLGNVLTMMAEGVEASDDDGSGKTAMLCEAIAAFGLSASLATSDGAQETSSAGQAGALRLLGGVAGFEGKCAAGKRSRYGRARRALALLATGAGHAAAVSALCTPSAAALTVEPRAWEARRGVLSAQTTLEVLALFRVCGVVAVSDAVGAAAVDRMRAAVDGRLNEELPTIDRHRAELRAREAASEPSGRGAALLEAETVAARDRFGTRYELKLPYSSVPYNESNIVDSETLIGLAKLALMSGAVTLDTYSTVVSFPGAPDGGWHADVEDPYAFHGISRGRSHPPPPGVVAIVPLVGVDETSGATAFRLGSHVRVDGGMWDRVGEEIDEATELDVRLHAGVGTVVLFDLRVLHRGTANRSPANRPILYLGYTMRWFRDVSNFKEGHTREWEQMPSTVNRALFARLDTQAYVARLERAAAANGVDVEALKARQVVHESEDDGGLVHTLVL